MKKYNIQNYIRYKEDLKRSMPIDKTYSEYTRDELIIRFLPLVENLGRKFPTSQQASGVLSINDIIQIGAEALTRAVDKINWERLEESDDMEKTLKSFFSKRIKGAIRRRIDMVRGGMRIPEHKLTEIRKSPKDEAIVQLFFNQVFLSLDSERIDTSITSPYSEGTYAGSIEDTSEPYNIALMNVYLLSIMKRHLNEKEYHVLRLSYGLDCDKHPAKEIAEILNIEGVSNYVRVSELKQKAIQKLIENVDHSQVIDYL